VWFRYWQMDGWTKERGSLQIGSDVWLGGVLSGCIKREAFQGTNVGNLKVDVTSSTVGRVFLGCSEAACGDPPEGFFPHSGGRAEVPKWEITCARSSEVAQAERPAKTTGSKGLITPKGAWLLGQRG